MVSLRIVSLSAVKTILFLGLVIKKSFNYVVRRLECLEVYFQKHTKVGWFEAHLEEIL